MECVEDFSGIPASVDVSECPHCGGALKLIGYRPPVSAVTDNPLDVDPSRMVTSIGKSVRSAQEQEKLYGRIIEDGKRRYKKMMAGNTRDDGCRMVARIPRELFMQKMRQHGKDYWHQGGDRRAQERALRREGLYWPEK